MIRLSSVTHSTNMNQRIETLSFTQAGGGLERDNAVQPEPASPGHYMLFILNSLGVPSIASIVQVG